MAGQVSTLRAAKLGGLAFALVLGWVFVLWTNNFHVTAPVVFVCLGYLAVVATVANLWRTGAAIVAIEPDDDWGRPIGERGELEKEKRTLLKAIKEAEFDLAMNKLSKGDADSLIRQYRARAIEVIKALDRLDAGAALSTKDQIAREVKARIELAASDKPSKRAKNAADKKATQAAGKADARAAKAAAAEADKARDEAGDKARDEAGDKARDEAGDKAGDETGDKAGDKADEAARDTETRDEAKADAKRDDEEHAADALATDAGDSATEPKTADASS
jgi:hypothetical protein